MESKVEGHDDDFKQHLIADDHEPRKEHQLYTTNIALLRKSYLLLSAQFVFVTVCFVIMTVNAEGSCTTLDF